MSLDRGLQTRPLTLPHLELGLNSHKPQNKGIGLGEPQPRLPSLGELVGKTLKKKTLKNFGLRSHKPAWCIRIYFSGRSPPPSTKE